MSLETITGYPLYWPDGWRRTPAGQRERSKYELDFIRARDEVARNLRLMAAHRVRISTNIPLRRDGLPLAGMREPEDPGVAVYWDQRGKFDAKRGDYTYTTRVIACDHWRTVRENMRAVAFALESLRQLDRCGASEILDRAYTGFTALPANAGASSRSWREVLGIEHVERPTPAIIDSAYRAKALQVHPDRPGGSDAAMAEVNAARAQALREVG